MSSGAQPGRPCAADLLLALVLGVAAGAWFLWVEAGPTAQGVLTGEEASIAHRDALALALHWQPSEWSTNVGGQLFYLLTGRLQGLWDGYTLFSPRAAKAVASALLAPLAFAVARRRLSCARVGAVAAAVLVVLVPGVSSLAWVAIETPLDALAGMAALYVATSGRRWWPVGGLLAGVSVSLYTAGLAWAVAVAVVLLARIRRPLDALGALLGIAAGVAVVVAPLAWWHNGGLIVTGGGRAGPDPGAAGQHLAEVLTYAVRSGGSYYYATGLPTLGGPVPAAVLVVGVVVAAVARFRAVWPWVLVALSCVALYAVSSGVPGARRVVALALVAALLTGVALDVLAHRRPWWTALLAAATALAVAAPMAVGLVGWRQELASGERHMVTDWPLPVAPGATQASTLGDLAAALRAGRLTPTQVGEGYGGTRTLALLYLLDADNGRPPPLTTDDVLRYYPATSDCRALDGPACGPLR
ncbi:hypothetical protein ACR9E3_23075 [Actinomycetospora sp. C-140]